MLTENFLPPLVFAICLAAIPSHAQVVNESVTKTIDGVVVDHIGWPRPLMVEMIAVTTGGQTDTIQLTYRGNTGPNVTLVGGEMKDITRVGTRVRLVYDTHSSLTQVIRLPMLPLLTDSAKVTSRGIDSVRTGMTVFQASQAAGRPMDYGAFARVRALRET
jgi:hypothetical protein